MDQLMWVVTFVALSLAVGMSFVAVRLLGGDRRRSAARVASLEAAALEDYERDPREDDVDTLEDHALMLDEPTFDDFRDADAAMFAATDEPRAPSRRWLALAAVAVVMAGLTGAAYMLFKPTTLGASPAAPASAPAPSSTAPPPATPTVDLRQVPIELLSLKHTIEGNTFTLAGLVQNPISGGAFSHVVAVVYLFDNDGSYFATGRADLEFRGLRPGEESPFTIKISSTAHVGRYRVGFRRDDGSVIAHIDKRGQPGAALMTEGK